MSLLSSEILLYISKVRYRDKVLQAQVILPNRAFPDLAEILLSLLLHLQV